MNTTTILFSILLVIVSTLLAVNYCMPEPQADYDSNYGGQVQRPYGRGRYGLSNYYARYGRGFGYRPYGRGLYSPSIRYYNPYYYNNPYYYYYNPYMYYRLFGYYPGAYGQVNRYGLYQRNRYNNGYGSGSGYDNGFSGNRDNMNGGMNPRYGGGGGGAGGAGGGGGNVDEEQ